MWVRTGSLRVLWRQRSRHGAPSSRGPLIGDHTASRGTPFFDVYRYTIYIVTHRQPLPASLTIRLPSSEVVFVERGDPGNIVVMDVMVEPLHNINAFVAEAAVLYVETESETAAGRQIDVLRGFADGRAVDIEIIITTPTEAFVVLDGRSDGCRLNLVGCILPYRKP